MIENENSALWVRRLFYNPVQQRQAFDVLEVSGIARDKATVISKGKRGDQQIKGFDLDGAFAKPLLLFSENARGLVCERQTRELLPNSLASVARSSPADAFIVSASSPEITAILVK